ncbi:MAG: hypothetical protein ACLP2U_05085 [Syntrophobacteraceae bacterium]
MIGIISRHSQKPWVEEFFELFKTPWEFYDPSKEYDVLIVTSSSANIPSAKLTIIYSQLPQSDIVYNSFSALNGSRLVGNGHVVFPIYRSCALFKADKNTLLKDKGQGLQVGMEYMDRGQRVLLIGYDLFDEIEFLLSVGQPCEFSGIPTVEIHISLLRQWILESGIPFIEIPPVPYGYGFIACLTHDVDFIGIKDHLLDRSLFGFIYRSLVPVYSKGLNFNSALPRLIKNLKAVVSLPAVSLGFARDFWFDIDRYMQMEEGIPATYFFIPFKNQPGHSIGIDPPGCRAAKYDIVNHKEIVRTLTENGNEIGLHGIDAWHHPQKGMEERVVIERTSGSDCSGVRMHWLYFSPDSPSVLEEAGLKYDSSLGYNETIGFRSGTTQVFRLPGSNLFELPLNIMDTALFTEKRLALSEDVASQLCECLIKDVSTYGGVLTINWHTRSLSPERNWDEFYGGLLQTIKKWKPWFASGQQAVNWHVKRRETTFGSVKPKANKLTVQLAPGTGETASPPLTLRTFFPARQSATGSTENHGAWYSIDSPISDSYIEVAV